jgi:hypothetical protein
MPHTGTTLRLTLFGSKVILLGIFLAACGGTPDRPPVQEVRGTTDHIVAKADAGQPEPASNEAEACEHGTVVECKIWITDVDCFTGLRVCDNGTLTGCMDENAAEATLFEISQNVE